MKICFDVFFSIFFRNLMKHFFLGAAGSSAQEGTCRRSELVGEGSRTGAAAGGKCQRVTRETGQGRRFEKTAPDERGLCNYPNNPMS